LDATHWFVAFAPAALHTVEHPPQWFGSVCSSTQVVPQSVGVPVGQLSLHE
jgi:hypothetical protein